MSLSRSGFLGAGSAAAAVTLQAEAALAAVGTASLLVLYKKPLDPGAFDTYYAKHHAPLAKALPGLQSYTLSKGLTGQEAFYLVAILTFASIAKLKTALRSPQGTAVTADLKNFAQAGFDILTFENIPA